MPNAVVTMFDSGGSSGQLRDELGVLPPGDILKCALALARNAREARRVLLARLPTLEHARLGGHTGGNLLLSMMQRYSGDFLDAIDGLRALLGCRGRVWPVSVQQASVCAEYGDGSVTRGEVEVDAGQSSGRFVRRIWLEPPVSIHPAVADGDRRVRRRHHRPGQLLHQPDADLPGARRAPRRWRRCKGPIILIANLLTEGRGMAGLHRRRRGRADRRGDPAAGRRRDRQHEVAVAAGARPLRARAQGAARGRATLPAHCELVGGEFWTGEIARHDRLRLAYAVWSVLSRRLLARRVSRTLEPAGFEVRGRSLFAAPSRRASWLFVSSRRLRRARARFAASSAAALVGARRPSASPPAR